MSGIQRYCVYALTFAVVVAISVTACLLWTGDWMPGLPIGVIVGVPLATFISWLFRPSGERKAMKERKPVKD